MIVWGSGVTARRLILIHTISARICQLKVKATFNYLLAIIWTPHPRNIKLLSAGISKTGYKLLLCKFYVNLGILVRPTKRKIESLLFIRFRLKEVARMKTEKENAKRKKN